MFVPVSSYILQPPVCKKNSTTFTLSHNTLFLIANPKPVNHKSISYRFHPCASILASSCPKLRGTLIAPSVPPSIDQPQAKRLRLTTKFPENPPQFLLFPLRSWSFIISKYDECPLQVETSWKYWWWNNKSKSTFAVKTPAKIKLDLQASCWVGGVDGAHHFPAGSQE